MRLFFYPLLLTIVLLIGFAKIATPIITKPQVIHKLPIHKTLYLDRFMSNNEVAHVAAAAIEWNQATNGDVSFDIQKLPKDGIDIKNAIFIINVTTDNPEIMYLDQGNQASTLGYYHTLDGVIDYVYLLPDRIEEKQMDGVIMHELGHALGLKHIMGIDGIGTLMCPSIELGALHISNDDVEKFCQLYHCNASKYHGQP